MVSDIYQRRYLPHYRSAYAPQQMAPQRRHWVAQRNAVAARPSYPPYFHSKPRRVAPPTRTYSTSKEAEAAAALISMPARTEDSQCSTGFRPGIRPIHPPSPNKPIIAISPIMAQRKLERIPPMCLPTSPSSKMTPASFYSHPTKAIVSPSRSIHADYNTDTSSVSSYESASYQQMEAQEQQWYQGSASLALAEDDDVLSPLHCFLRRYCVEAFTATQEDVATPRYGKSHVGKVVVGQVGIRCIHCKHLDRHDRPERAVCYPSSLRNIYHSIETWQRRHSILCTSIPAWIKVELTRLLESSRSNAGGRRQYWEDSAKRIGLVDTLRGVRFARHPGILDSFPKGDSVPAVPLVTTADRANVTEFLFLLMEQMEKCKFSEEDRTGGRSKVKNYPVGFPGMQCKHCRGKAGFGRYFPASVDALALANSDRNIYNHIRKCRRCPEDTKQELSRLQRKQAEQGSKNKRGSRKQFFTNVWGRIHGEA